MSASDLAKPGSATVMITSTDLGGPSDTGAKFYMKAYGWRIRARTRIEDVTGQGDTNPPCFLHNDLTYVRVVLIGAMIESQAIGLANLGSSTNNPIGSVELHFSSGRSTLLDNAIIEMIDISNSSREGTNKVQMVMHATQTAQASLDN